MFAHAPAAPPVGRFPSLLVSALGVGQVVAWGSFFYVFVSLTDPMIEEFGWSKTQISGALSVVLAVSGLCAYARGRWIDQYGGRSLMTVGACLGTALLVLWSFIGELWQLYAVAVGLGVVSALVLYDAVFAVVARLLGPDYRKGIVVITLFGGLASTVFVPLTQFLVDNHGWRSALRLLVLLQLPICAGVPFLLLRGRELRRPAPAADDHSPAPSIRSAIAHPVFWLLAISFVSSAFMFISLLFNVVPMLREVGFTTSEAVLVYACIGPSQLAGRVSMLTLERFLSITVAGLIGTLFPVVAMIIVITLQPGSPLVFVFAIAFGTGMGVKTIVQATAAPEFLGREQYGALQGALMFPVLLVQAGAPLIAAWLWQIRGNYDLLEAVLLAAAALSAVSFVLASRLRPSRHEPGPSVELMTSGATVT